MRAVLCFALAAAVFGCSSSAVDTDEDVTEGALELGGVEVDYGRSTGEVVIPEAIVEEDRVIFVNEEPAADGSPNAVLYLRDIDAKEPARKLWSGPEYIRAMTHDRSTIFLLTSADRGLGPRSLWSIPKAGGEPVRLLDRVATEHTSIAAALDEDILVFQNFAKKFSVRSKRGNELPRDVLTLESVIDWTSDGKSVFTYEDKSTRLVARSIADLAGASRVLFDPRDVAAEARADSVILTSNTVFMSGDAFFAVGTVHSQRGAQRAIVERRNGSVSVALTPPDSRRDVAPKISSQSLCFNEDVRGDDIVCVSPGSSAPVIAVHADDSGSKASFGRARAGNKRVFYTRSGHLYSRRFD